MDRVGVGVGPPPPLPPPPGVVPEVAEHSILYQLPEMSDSLARSLITVLVSIQAPKMMSRPQTRSVRIFLPCWTLAGLAPPVRMKKPAITTKRTPTGGTILNSKKFLTLSKSWKKSQVVQRSSGVLPQGTRAAEAR